MQCDVHANRRDPAGPIPFLLDVQADLLDELETRVVVPLVRAAQFGRRARGLHPEFELSGERLVMATHLMAAIRSSDLGEVVASLRPQRDAIISAVDVLLEHDDRRRNRREV